jgi:nitrogen fixation/metabolism regulation signal transduction histidine kinase
MDPISLYARDREKRAVGRALRLALIASVALAGVLLAFLATASANTALFERHYPLLLWGNAAIALALALLTAELLRRIALRARRRVFGSRLMIRLALTFTAMAVMPGLLIYFVGVQFLGRSIESWFDVPVDRALESGVNLGRSAFEAIQADLVAKSRRMANELADQPSAQWQSSLDRIRDQLGVQEAIILSSSGRLLISSGAPYAQLAPDLPASQILQQVRLTRLYAAVEGLDLLGESPATDSGRRPTGGLGPLAPALPGAIHGPLKVRVVQSILTSRPGEELRYLQLLQTVPIALAINADAVAAGQREYQQLSLSRQGLKRIFNVTLTLTFLLTIFSSVAGAFLLSGWLTGPLTMLAAGTRAVAEGDYRPVKDYGGRDELGVLTQSFNLMTRQLEEARGQVANHQRDLEQAKARLERVLASLSAAVLAFDSDYRLTMSNLAADRVLGVVVSNCLGQPIESLPGLAPLAAPIREAFASARRRGLDHWQRQFVIGEPSGEPSGESSNEPIGGPIGGAIGQGLEREPSSSGGFSDSGPSGPARTAVGRTLLASGTTLPGAISPLPGVDGLLIVFDDVSELVSAQRTLAWNEVARRLAHEIKNPLTPIQLTAERLPRKLAGKLDPVDADFLRRGALTIVNQVEALARLVDDFRTYARLPTATVVPLDLNELVREVLLLYGGHEAESELAQDGLIRVRLAEIPPVLADAAQLRQVLHNLIKNAQEATASVQGGRIEVTTTATEVGGGSGVGASVHLRVRDEGPGFPPGILARAFEPYVTAKPKGTGLGLAIVRKMVDEQGARITLENRFDPNGVICGAQVEITFTRIAV